MVQAEHPLFVSTPKLSLHDVQTVADVHVAQLDEQAVQVLVADKKKPDAHYPAVQVLAVAHKRQLGVHIAHDAAPLK